MKARRFSGARKTMLWAAGLTAALIFAAILFVWLNGAGTIPQPPESVDTAKSVKPEARKPDPNARPSAAIEYLTTPVLRGTNASITIKTIPTAECTIKVTYKGVVSTDSGLKPKIADDRGSLQWAWTVNNDAASGIWPVDVYCYYNKLSAYVRGDLEVVDQLPQH